MAKTMVAKVISELKSVSRLKNVPETGPGDLKPTLACTVGGLIYEFPTVI